MSLTRYDLDPEALDWARTAARRQITLLRGVATRCEEQGQRDRAAGYRGAVLLLENGLIGGGQEVGAFDERRPELLVHNATQW